MKLHIDGVVHFGKFEFAFKTAEVKFDFTHEKMALHVAPKKVGVAFVHTDKVVHLGFAFLFAKVGFTFNK